MSYINPEVIVKSIEDVDPFTPALVYLVNAGYGFNGDEEYARFQATQEYSGDHKLAYFVKVDGLEVGSLVVSDLSPTATADKLHSLWANLPTPLSQKLQSISPHVFGMSGIVVHPTFIGQKLADGRSVARTLLDTFAKEQQPSMVLGSTKSPRALLTRSRVLGDHGLRTFYGFNEVTPNHTGLPSDKNQLKQILDAYWKSHVPAYQPDGNGVYYKSTDILTSEVPNLDQLPTSVIKAFEPVVKAQLLVGTDKTAVSTLISIDARFFE